MVNPIQSGQIDRAVVERLAQSEYHGVERLKNSHDVVTKEYELFQLFKGKVQEFVENLRDLSQKGSFQSFVVTSEDPDALSLDVVGDPLVGQYNIQIDQLASRARMLSERYDSPSSPIGFGYLTIEVGDQIHHLRMAPGSTVEDLVDRIEKDIPDLKAQILDTRLSLEEEGQKNYQLVAHSLETGKKAKLYVDPDLTDLNPQELKSGKNLKISYEGLEVFNDENQLSDLIPGLRIDFKRTTDDPVQVSVSYDLEKMAENFGELIQKYNEINQFINEQNTLDPQTNRLGPLGNESSLNRLRSSVRQLLVNFRGIEGGLDRSVMDFGVTTNPHSGALLFDQKKFIETFTGEEKKAVEYFCQTPRGDGLLGKFKNQLELFLQAPSGPLSSKEKEYKQKLDNMQRQIQVNQERADRRADEVRRKFQKLEGVLQEMQTQNQYLQQVG
jgi:flagellar hook-associated protein 2